jgi:hypothetical protein
MTMKTGLIIKMDRSALLCKVAEQRLKHLAEYELALAGWREKMTDMCMKVVGNYRKLIAYPRDLHKLSQMPEKHVEDFDNAIAMLENATDEVIELDQDLFNTLVQGKWDWQSQFQLTNSVYGAHMSKSEPVFSPGIRANEVEE